MARINEVHSIIIGADTPNFSAHTYTEVYGGSAGCAIIINGNSANIGAGSSVNISVRTVSGGTGCYLLGVFKDVTQGTTSVG